jgi:hypothetical protein
MEISLSNRHSLQCAFHKYDYSLDYSDEAGRKFAKSSLRTSSLGRQEQTAANLLINPAAKLLMHLVTRISPKMMRD